MKEGTYEDLFEAIKPLAEQMQQLYKQAYIAYQPQVERLIKMRVKDENTIEHLLDGILDFCADSEMLLLYKQLCRYYWHINPQATAEHIMMYREMWDSDADKETDDATEIDEN
jgi:hypothetical protein